MLRRDRRGRRQASTAIGNLKVYFTDTFTKSSYITYGINGTIDVHRITLDSLEGYIKKNLYQRIFSKTCI
jgi:hypothetical protein